VGAIPGPGLLQQSCSRFNSEIIISSRHGLGEGASALRADNGCLPGTSIPMGLLSSFSLEVVPSSLAPPRVHSLKVGFVGYVAALLRMPYFPAYELQQACTWRMQLLLSGWGAHGGCSCFSQVGAHMADAAASLRPAAGNTSPLFLAFGLQGESSLMVLPPCLPACLLYCRR
jgi:hypothetical protein